MDTSKRVVITGASRGIGRALARAFASRGHALVLAARSLPELQQIAAELPGTQIVACDLGTVEGRDALAAAVPGPIAGLVNNAGFGTAGEFAGLDRARERALVRLNCEAVVDLSHAFLPQLGPGSFIMNLASTASFQPVPLLATYAASKAFVLSLSEALADELSPRGVHVLALCPGVTESGFQKEADVALPPGSPSAEQVAAWALRALERKQRVAVHGLRNSLLAFGNRFAPRRVTVAMARKVMEPWFRDRKP